MRTYHASISMYNKNMKGIFIALLIVLVAGLGLYYWNGADPKVETARYVDESLPLSFEYPTGEEGYVVLEQDSNGSEPDLVKRIVILQKADYQSVLGGEREGGEGPAGITIQIYRNPANRTLNEWIESNPGASNFPLIQGEITNTSVDNNLALSYEADGLYASRNVVFAEGENIYHISGGYLDRESSLYRDFEKIINSIKIGE